MPLYEYECLVHGRFGHLLPMRGGHTEFFCSSCPECGDICNGVISLSNFRMAIPLTVVDNGKILHYKPDGGSTPPPVEDIARDEKKGMY